MSVFEKYFLLFVDTLLGNLFFPINKEYIFLVDSILNKPGIISSTLYIAAFTLGLLFNYGVGYLIYTKKLRTSEYFNQKLSLMHQKCRYCKVVLPLMSSFAVVGGPISFFCGLTNIRLKRFFAISFIGILGRFLYLICYLI